jgi:SAM-dependent methyltransferase
VKLNVGCGLDVREGWVNLDTEESVLGRGLLPGLYIADARDLRMWHGQYETVLLNHVLHLFDYTDAEKVLDECVACLAPEGELVIVEADILVAFDTFMVSGETDWLWDVVADDVEPTTQGKLLRWATWHGTRRSMWSTESLIERLTRRGLTADETEPIWGREAESFAVFGARP